MTPITVLRTAITTRLKGSVTLTKMLATGKASIYRNDSPDQALMPFVRWNIQSGINEDPRGLEDIVIQVRAFAATETMADTVRDAFDALLDDVPLNVAGYTNYHIGRLEDIDMTEANGDGTITYSPGILYRILLDK